MKTMINTTAAKLATKLGRKEEGQGMVEYSLILALVSVVAIVTLTAMGTGVIDVFDAAGTALNGAAN